MSLAPLDAWVRLLFFPRAKVGLRYSLRLAIALTTSAIATIVTLPERLVLALLFRFRKQPNDPNRAPIFILGYYRSGTTYLQYLLGRDPSLYTPRWLQALAPQGFVLSWSLLRFGLMLPFMGATRPVDALAFGPDVPAEDDIALSNWAAASALPGRMLLPQQHDFYDRFLYLNDLNGAELSRWRSYLEAFAQKISILASRRRLLFKSPSHTARVKALLRRVTSGTAGAFPPHRYQGLEIDFVARRAHVDGVEVSLTRREFEVLAYFARNAGKILLHRQVLQAVWGGQYGDESDYVWTFVQRIRRKIEPDRAHPRYVLTEAGVGYRMPAPEDGGVDRTPADN